MLQQPTQMNSLDVLPFVTITAIVVGSLQSEPARFRARLHEKIYFGSTPVALVRVAGTVHPFSEADWTLDPASSHAVLARSEFQLQAGARELPPNYHSTPKIVNYATPPHTPNPFFF